MQIFNTSHSLLEYLPKVAKPLGIVPTMGALHSGHLSLIERAIKENQSVLISIFVNPTQFDDKIDFELYPAKIDSDLHLIKKFGEKVLVYLPKVEDVYGNVVESKSFDLGGLDKVMEGEKRSGHFQGVATVVIHFLKIFSPENAYFGEKDFQQLLIIKHVVRSQNLQTKIIGCTIIRESDGLAMSSRNNLLPDHHRKVASKLFETLQFARSNAKKVPYGTLKNMVSSLFEKDNNFTLDYFQIADKEKLKEIHLDETVDQARGFIAAYLGKIRLIDNLDMS